MAMPPKDTYGEHVRPVRLFDENGNAIAYGFTPAPELTDASGKIVKAGPGVIGDITCTKSGSGNSLAVYDGTSASGTLLTTIVGATVGMKFCELWTFSVGCYIQQSGGTPGSFAASSQ